VALRRATSELVLEEQLHALWEAIGFYAAKATVGRVFKRRELKALRESTPEWMSEAQRKRYEDLISKLNDAPLRYQVLAQIAEDGVPMTRSEQDLLFGKLRTARNKGAHGEQIVPPTRAEIHRGIGLVARMLVYQVAGRISRGDDASER
jgi:hypothetical protein